MKSLCLLICGSVLTVTFAVWVETAAATDWKELPEDTAVEKEIPRKDEAQVEAATEAESEAEKADEMPAGAIAVSGVVRIMRNIPETEVFFKDQKESVIIPFGMRHNSIFDACEDSRKRGTPVSLVVNAKNRRVLSVSTKKESDSKLPASEPSKSPVSTESSK